MKSYSAQGVLRQVREITVLIVLAVAIRTFIFGLYQVPTGSMETTMLVGERFFADKLTPFFRPITRGEIISFNDPAFVYSTNPVVKLFQQYLWGPANWTKRVIGIPGDHVQGVIEDGKPVVYLNGQKLDEPYLNKYPLVPSEDGSFRSWDPKKPFNEQPFYRFDPDRMKQLQWRYERAGQLSRLDPATPLPEYCGGSDTFDVKLGPNQYWVMGDNRLGSDDSRRWGILDGSLIYGRILWRILSIDSNESWLLLDILKNPIDFWTRVRWSRCLELVC
jgi:signal peptidase I